VGVTKTAVSLALRESEGISLEMRAKIRSVAAEMGYVADPILRRLAEYRRTSATGRFQSVIAWLNHWDRPEQLRSYHAFEEYWRGAKLAAKRLGYRLIEFIWPAGCPAKLAEHQLLERRVLGLLIPPHRPEVNWRDFDWGKFSLMRFGMTVSRVDANLVTSDHQRAIVMAIKKIHDYGYRRIGLVYSATHDAQMGGHYYGGFMWACKTLGIERPIPPLDFDQQNPPDDDLRALKAWMQTNQPDAVLTTQPQTPPALRKLGYPIPRDVALAGTSLRDIPLNSAIDQCPHAIGQIAAEMLIKQISLNERGEPADPCRILVESRWHDGNTLPPRSTPSAPSALQQKHD
jgi:DNA-binding LacI/PurR family transcriptional regulator